MGVNFSQVYNETGCPVWIVSFNCSDVCFWYHRDARQLPAFANDQAVEVNGLAGGNAVQVAVVYNKFFDGERFVCDVFRVEDGGTLTIKNLTSDSGVTAWDGEARLTHKGKAISLGYMKDDVMKVLSIVPSAIIKK